MADKDFYENIFVFIQIDKEVLECWSLSQCQNDTWRLLKVCCNKFSRPIEEEPRICVDVSTHINDLYLYIHISQTIENCGGVYV